VGIEGSRVAVLGGSIAGCSAAIALSRAGCEVTVHERSGGRLEDRGLGIGMPPAAFGELVSAGFLDESMAMCAIRKRAWFAADGSDTGKPVWRQDVSLLLTNWGVLWRNLRAKVPDAHYRHPLMVTGIRQEPGGAVVVSEEGEDRFDVVVGADGYRSLTRPVVAPQAKAAYAGYVLWRGDFPADRLPDQVLEEFTETAVTVGFEGGHAILYLIPDPVGDGLRMNWAVYDKLPDRFQDPASLAPGSLDDDLLTTLDQTLAKLPPYWAEIIGATDREHLSLQPIYDVHAAAYTGGRVLLAGDAAALVRPHIGMGVVKAIHDAIALEFVCRKHQDWPEALTDYDDQRRTVANELVERGRRMGHAMVTRTPPWATMQPANYEEWARAMQT
jgi:2-polyprenyl-6-methoxyphenol hydroxylase-like FAD-dependent oxidoreductase